MHLLKLAAFSLLVPFANFAWAQESTPEPTPTPVPIVEKLQAEAEALEPLVQSEPAKQFLRATSSLPHPGQRIVHSKPGGVVVSNAEFEKLEEAEREGWKKHELPEAFYYTTRYGSPLAFVRTIDIAAQSGLENLSGARVVDFGFGSIGQLRLMASLGAHATGIEVDPLLKALYSEPGDTGAIAPAQADGKPGHLDVLIGYFPSDNELVTQLGTGFDLFVSKNTLKKGYIHPEREADPRTLIDLGVSDEEFVKAVHTALKPGGLFLIYNLHPKMSAPDEKFVPWSDGRSPFSRETFEAGGFEVLEFDKDDTAFAHSMARALGWEAHMDLEKDLFGTYTLLRKK